MEKIIACFKVGRGGRFHNPGYVRFCQFCTRLQDGFDEGDMIIDTDENGRELPAEEWTLIDDVGNELLRGRDEIEAETGRIDRDGIYDTFYAKNIEDCTEEELRAIVRDNYYSTRGVNDAVDYAHEALGVPYPNEEDDEE